MNKPLLFVLLFFTSICLFSQKISVKEFHVLRNDQTARINNPVIDQNGEKCALIKVVTTVQGMLFEGGMLGIMKREWKNGEYWVYIPHGAKKITIKHDKFQVLRDYIYPEAIHEATVYEMILTTGRVKTIVEEPEIKSQLVVITTYPEEADVTIDDVFRGQTPFSQEFKEGKHTFRISKDLYHNVAGQFELLRSEGKKRLQYKLKPNYGFISIKSTPESGADITLDGVVTDKTTPFKTNKIKSGKHKVKLTHKWYEDAKMEIEVIDNETADLVIPLKPRFGELTINALPKADIYIDGKKEGMGNLKKRFLGGSYNLEIKKDMYHNITENIEVKAGESLTKSFELKPAFGSIAISTKPENGAEVSVDDIPTGKTTPFNLYRLSSGEHLFTLRREWYEPKKFRVTIEDAVNYDTIIELIPTFVDIAVTTSPEADIYIDNRKVGFGSYNGRVNTGIHTFKAQREKYYSDSKKEEIILNNTYNINLSPTPKQGTLKVESDPFDALIFLNNKDSGTTPKIFYDLLIGEYDVKITKVGYSSYEKKVVIEEGQTESINAKLLSGKLVRITSKPEGAELYIDYQFKGFTPYTAELTFGKHNIKLSKDDYDEFKKDFNINESAIDIDIDLIKSITKTSKPDNSELYIEPEEEYADGKEIFSVVESMPEFPGGIKNLYEFLGENMEYPTIAMESGIQGRVFVTFVVEKDGSITNVEVLRGIGGGCDEEAIRVVKLMPKWKPGTQRGKPVRVQYNLPLKFTLK